MSTPAEVDKPRRLRAVDVIDKLLARRATSSEQVSLRRNAKGDVQIEVEAVAGEGEALAEAAARCRSVFDALAADYPMQTNGAGDGR